MKERVLLIQPPLRKFYDLAYRRDGIHSSPPLGLLYLASRLRMHGYEPHVMDMINRDVSRRDFTEKIRTINPWVAGISVHTETACRARDVIKEIRKSTNAVIVAGGVHTTFCAEEFLEPGTADYVLAGEADSSLIELLELMRCGKAKEAGFKIPGLAYSNNDGKMVIESAKRGVRNLDSMPLPARELIAVGHYRHSGALTGSRGCLHRCVFCCSREMFGSGIRSRSSDNIFSEIVYLCREGVKHFTFYDQFFSYDRRKTIMLLKLMSENLEDVTWECQTRIDALDAELIELMAVAGCRKVKIGIESGDQDILEGINKKLRLKDVEPAINLLKDAGITVFCYFMLGLPGDTHATMQKTIAYAERLKNLYGVQICLRLNTPFPGTAQFCRSREMGLNILHYDWDKYCYFNPVMEGEGFNADFLRSLFVETASRLGAKEEG